MRRLAIVRLQRHHPMPGSDCCKTAATRPDYIELGSAQLSSDRQRLPSGTGLEPPNREMRTGAVGKQSVVASRRHRERRVTRNDVGHIPQYEVVSVRNPHAEQTRGLPDDQDLI